MRTAETSSSIQTSLLAGTIFANHKFGKVRMAVGLIGVVLFALLLRILLLSSAPKGALIDEAHFGYIAYSLLKTGKDEHGVAWPLIFQGFGDQKLPLYGYSLLPVINFFGLSNITIRIPSILAGLSIVWSIYAAAKRAFGSHMLALFAALMIAINPWPFFLSRFGFESNLGLAFFCIGLWAMVVSISDRRMRWPVITAITWAVSWYAYIAFRPLTILLGLIFFGWRFLQERKLKPLLVFLVPLILLVAPLLLTKAASSNTARLNQIGILKDPGMIQMINEQRTFCDMKFPRQACYIFWNKPVYIVSELFRRYATVFAPQYMATEGEVGLIFLNVAGYGQVYLVLYPFLLLGMLALVSSRDDFPLPAELRVLLISGLLLTPIPTILVGDPQKVRISALLPFVFITIALGIVFALKFIKQKRWQQVLFQGTVAAMCGLAVFYFVNYFVFHTVRNDYYYQSYVPELMEFVSHTDTRTTVVFKPFFSDPLMFYAYYTHMDPAEYQQNAELGELEPSGFQHTTNLGRFQVRDQSLYNVGCVAAKTNTPTLFVGNSVEPNAVPIKEIRSANDALVYARVYDALQLGRESKCSN